MTQVLETQQSQEESAEPALARRQREIDPYRQYATLIFMRGAVGAIAIAMVSGLLGALYYIPAVSPVLQRMGIHFTALRPIHTTFAVVFILLAGVAVVHRYFEDIAGTMKSPERLRLKVQVISWTIAAVGILGSYIAGVFSGREYMGFHPIFSIPIMLGWIMFAWNFFSHVGRGILTKPVYVTMWGVGTLFFIYTFTEQHAWLLPGVFAEPIVDMRIQWKATGTLVGSFNLFVYGTLYFVGCKLSKNESYAHSRMAYALFGVGLLNSFTNFAHHTYHLPQGHLIKWISFVVSMAEIILLARVIWDITGMVKARRPSPPCGIQLFMASAKWWTGFILVTSILISIPPINTLIHGTRLVMGHAMGAMIGIDSMALFAAITWMLIEVLNRRGKDAQMLSSRRYLRWIIGFNIGVAGLVGWLTISGIGTAIYRYEGLATPEWIVVAGPFIFVVCGLIASYFLMQLILTWLGVLVQPASLRAKTSSKD
ncbi:MAG: cbb3-type cytochrome c oxidase subunit I [Phycisphaerales bacterium]|nr:cbb3-type cytochrome c oxidase subunit I [Phycisphaerales bacterium]